MANDGVNGNTDFANPASILSDVWSESGHYLRTGAGSSSTTGKTYINLYANAAASGTTTTETAITLTKSTGTAATSSAASFVVTSGKTFRITSISVATRGNATGTAQITTFNLRVNTAGAVITSSTPVVWSASSACAAVNSAWDRYAVSADAGIVDITGDGTLQIGMTAAATFTTNAPTWFVNITGYEY